MSIPITAKSIVTIPNIMLAIKDGSWEEENVGTATGALKGPDGKLRGAVELGGSD